MEEVTHNCSQGNLYQPRKGTGQGPTQLGISWLWVPSRVNPLPSSYGLALFSRQPLVLQNVREWVCFTTGTACLRNVPTT